MAKRRQTLKCPVCKLEVRASRLDAHIRNIHPGTEERYAPGAGGSHRPRNPGVFFAAAVAAVLVVAAVGIYYVNLPRPEENGEGPGIPPVGAGVFPTQYVRMEVASRGTIVIGLYGNETPKTVKNFSDLVAQNYFVGTVFHRIVAGFVIQGGGFTPDLTQKPVPSAPIKLEINNKLHNYRGTLAMARTNDPDSATTQFFINLVDNTPGKLDPGGYSVEGYAVFGVVVRGMDVVDNIASAKTEYAPGNTQEKSQPTQDEIPMLVVTNTMMMPSPDG